MNWFLDESLFPCSPMLLNVINEPRYDSLRICAMIHSNEWNVFRKCIFPLEHVRKVLSS